MEVDADGALADSLLDESLLDSVAPFVVAAAVSVGAAPSVLADPLLPFL